MNIIDPIPSHRCVAVFGLGCSGIAAAHLLHRLGKRVIASDCADETRRADFLLKLPPGTELVLGRNEIGDATAIVTSPGLEPSLPIFAEAAQKHVDVLAELELAACATDTPIVAITGTDGKTTTTSLTAHLLAVCGIRNACGGNIGIPLAQVVLQCADDTARFVVETSAFQLAFCPRFHPHCLIATNIAEDHSEYFKGDWDAYVSTKRRMLANMTPEDWAILNASDPEIRTWNTRTTARLCYYAASRDDLPADAVDYAYFDGTDIHIAFGGKTFSFAFERTGLRGRHNAMNAMAAILAACIERCSFSDIIAAFDSYQLPHHRIEYICSRDGVDFIDDSKATNPHAAIAALQALQAPSVLIVGGVDKGLHLGEWLEEMKHDVKHIVVIGALTERFCREAQEVIPEIPRHCTDSLEHAVVLGYELALADACRYVVLSPGCSSYDMFKSYTERGRVFAESARGIVAKNADA